MAIQQTTSSLAEGLLKEIKSGNFKPVYLLMGEETYYIDLICEEIQKNALTEDERAFNETILYGGEISAQTLIDECNFFPSFAQRHIVVLKEAQTLKEIEKLEHYLQRPQPTTILIINYKYGNADRRKKWVSLIDKIGFIFESKKLYDNQIEGWIKDYIGKKKYKIEEKALFILKESLGTQLSKISQELQKLFIALPQGKNIITSEDIEKNIGISKEYNNFELQKAFAEREVEKVYRIVYAFGKNPKSYPIMVTISILFNYFSNLFICQYLKDKSNENVRAELKLKTLFQVKDYLSGLKNYSRRQVFQIISILREYDAKSKGFQSTTSSQDELLREMTFKILNS
ncbi:MAG TPA: DNA polymerase III subunit delta [Porphyromonadaceae bacterium]|nr:DNA polymerase III subunit delta [Porphyromonadaceae bacterium]